MTDEPRLVLFGVLFTHEPSVFLAVRVDEVDAIREAFRQKPITVQSYNVPPTRSEPAGSKIVSLVDGSVTIKRPKVVPIRRDDVQRGARESAELQARLRTVRDKWRQQQP